MRIFVYFFVYKRIIAGPVQSLYTAHSLEVSLQRALREGIAYYRERTGLLTPWAFIILFRWVYFVCFSCRTSAYTITISDRKFTQFSSKNCYIGTPQTSSNKLNSSLIIKILPKYFSLTSISGIFETAEYNFLNEQNPWTRDIILLIFSSMQYSFYFIFYFYFIFRIIFIFVCFTIFYIFTFIIYVSISIVETSNGWNPTIFMFFCTNTLGLV